ncbi:MAG: GGDEF domain-containing protein [Deltaproteobacteria bacterium]|jgi:diguanylate cyclase|nr:GGDEF domain-containing protein [Deltaproteobacteria bacterium]
MPQILIEESDKKPTDKPPVGNQDFDNLVEATYEMAKKILPFLARRKIPLTPDNYRIFYDYFLLLKPDLGKKIDDLLANNCRFSPDISEELFRDFYQPEEFQFASVEKVSERLSHISEAIHKNLGATLDDTFRFRDILTETVNQINLAQPGEQNLKLLVDNLLDETVSALSSQSDLASHMEKTRQLIASLTSELKDQARLANIDELTQLFNRRYFGRRLSHILAEGGDDLVLSVIIFDLDRFKAINDTWGHNIGDKVLALCAKIIKSNAGENYMAVRFGGEEFLLLCPGLGREETLALAETIRGQVESTAITFRGKPIKVSISCGLTQRQPGDSEEDFVARADQALYLAKEAGRNQVRVL